MSEFKIGPVPSGSQNGLTRFLLDVKKRLDILGGNTEDKMVSTKDLIDLGLIDNSGNTTVGTIEWDDITGNKPDIDADNTGENGQGYEWVTGQKPDQDADNTADNNQDWDWITGAKPDVDADNTADNGQDWDWITGAKPAQDADNFDAVAGVLAKVDVVTGNDLTVTGGETDSGLYMNQNYVGFYNSVSDTFKTYMASNGDFRLEGSGSNYVYWNGSIFAYYGGNVEFQSNADNISMLSFKNTESGRYFDFFPDASGYNLSLKPRTLGNILIGDVSTTNTTALSATTTVALETSGTSYGAPFSSEFELTNISARLKVASSYYYYFAAGEFFSTREASCGTQDNPWIGVVSRGLYGDCITNSYTSNSQIKAASQYALYYGLAGKAPTSHNHSGHTLTPAAITATGTIDYQGSTYTRGLGTWTVYPRGHNTFYNGTATAAWKQTHTEYLLVGNSTYASSIACIIRGQGTGTGYTLLTENSSGVDKFFVTDAGDATLAGTLTENSERKNKKDIKIINEIVIGKLLRSNPITYKKIDEDEVPATAGFILEDIEEDFPLLVNRIGTIHGIKYTRFIPYIVKGQQEQQVYIDALADWKEDAEMSINSLKEDGNNVINIVELLAARITEVEYQLKQAD